MSDPSKSKPSPANGVIYVPHIPACMAPEDGKTFAQEGRTRPPAPDERCCRKSKYMYTIKGVKEPRCELHEVKGAPSLGIEKVEDPKKDKKKAASVEEETSEI